MTISRIKNTMLRRTVLVVFIAPIIVLAVIVAAAVAMADALRDAPGAFAESWEGDK